MAEVSVLCAVLVLLLIGWLLKTAQGGWLAPGPFFALYWAIGLAGPQILAPDFIQSQAAVWYIVALGGAFGIGSWTAAMEGPVRDERTELRPLNRPALRWLVAIGTVTGFVATVAVQVANGYSIGAIVSAQALLDAAAAFSVERYAGETSTPVLVPVLLAVTYAAAMVAPFAAQGLNRWRTLACYLGPAAGATMYAVLTTARFGMLTVAFFLFAGWVAAQTRANGHTPRPGGRTLIVTALAFVALAVTFVSIAFLRVGRFDPQIRGVIADKLRVYAAGYMPAFSQWFEQEAPTFPATWGASTFTGLIPSTGGGSVGFSTSIPTGTGEDSNIFTAWRFLVEDFGVALALVAIAGAGWVITRAWRKVIRHPDPASLVLLICGYAYVMNSSTQTLFLFTNVVAAVAIAYAALSLRRRPPRAPIESPQVRAVRQMLVRLGRS